MTLILILTLVLISLLFQQTLEKCSYDVHSMLDKATPDLNTLAVGDLRRFEKTRNMIKSYSNRNSMIVLAPPSSSPETLKNNLTKNRQCFVYMPSSLALIFGWDYIEVSALGEYFRNRALFHDCKHYGGDDFVLSIFNFLRIIDVTKIIASGDGMDAFGKTIGHLPVLSSLYIERCSYFHDTCVESIMRSSALATVALKYVPGFFKAENTVRKDFQEFARKKPEFR
ncbi:hypothetical protein BDA99DRAFT_533392 [Phascolomyces articulosus]|uniref:Uncharacterized protein n=1 Tax=Phascolomyces articulosus TaxID=60185 RepID=A0AAD5K9E2_9FUNG|nr:hypothetical protein BDA99DRAFT_533392 [Phascolomyces articulosus]